MRREVIGACLIWVVALGGATAQRCQTWSTELRLWSDAAAKTPKKPRPWINLGLAREQAGDLPGAFQAYSAALALSYQPRISHYQQRFSNVAARTNIARALAMSEHVPEAEMMLTQIVTEFPRFAHAHYNLGVLYAKTGRCEQATAHIDAARTLEPDFPPMGAC